MRALTAQLVRQDCARRIHLIVELLLFSGILSKRLPGTWRVPGPGIPDRLHVACCMRQLSSPPEDRKGTELQSLVQLLQQSCTVMLSHVGLYDSGGLDADRKGLLHYHHCGVSDRSNAADISTHNYSSTALSVQQPVPYHSARQSAGYCLCIVGHELAKDPDLPCVPC